MSHLDDLDLIKKLDKSAMAKLIIDMPEHIDKGYNEAVIHSPTPFTGGTAQVNHIIICGMGGSAISADIAKVLFEDKLPITVVKDFRLPHIDDNTLVIVISYSGNTAESIECLKQAKSYTRNLSVITSGGAMPSLLTLDKLWIQLPTGFPPRAAIGYLFFSLIKILELYKIIPDQKSDIDLIVNDMRAKAQSIDIDTATKQNFAKSSAEQIFTKVPVIYSSSPRLAPIAYRWKCQINENAKYPAFSHTFPEMLHNEIEGWERPSDVFIPIFLRSFGENAQYANGIKAFQTLLQGQDTPYLEFYTDDNANPYNLFPLIYLGDMISFYLGILHNVDPTEIKFINYIKKHNERI